MLKQINARLQSLLLATIAAAFILVPLVDPSFAQDGIGKKYNSRESQ